MPSPFVLSTLDPYSTQLTPSTSPILQNYTLPILLRLPKPGFAISPHLAELIDATSPGYSLHSAARSSSSTKSNKITGGGTAFLITEPATIINSSAHSYSSFEYSSITLKLHNSKLSIVNLYCPPPPSPYSQPYSVNIDQLSSLLTHVSTTPNEFILTGDFNPLDAGRRSTDFAQTPYAAGSLLTDGTVYERSGW